MGLFDKVLGGGQQTVSAPEGVAGIVLASVAADGVLTMEEMHGLATSLMRMRLFQGMNERQLNGVFEKVMKVAQSKGPDELLRMSAEAVPKDLRTTVFAVAADLVFADQEVVDSERRFLEKIQKSLQVPDETALKIVEVMQIKNKG